MRTVKIRSWDDMAEEFGITSHGDIKTTPPFVKYMKDHCGGTIDMDNYLCHDTWEFSEQMFEPADNYCMVDGCPRKRRKDENMCTTCTIAALRFELTKAQEKAQRYKDMMVTSEKA